MEHGKVQWSSYYLALMRGQLRGEGMDHTWKRGFSICGFLEHFDFETCK